MSHRLLLGAHISIAGGMEKAFDRAALIGCTCMQIFTKSNLQWSAKPLTEEKIIQFTQRAQLSSIRPVIAHTSYLINLGSSSQDIEKKSISSLHIELSRCHALHIPYLVLHPGAYVKGSINVCLKKIAHNLNTVFNQVPGKTIILLENMAGQGTVIGYALEQLASIYEESSFKHRLGFCIDTCHAFTAGYDLRNKEAYNAFWQQFDSILGINKLKVIHINDSVKGLGSRIDRHTHIGKGTLTLETFRLLFNDPRFFDIPKILETPKDNGFQADIDNIKTIMQLLTNETKTILKL